MLLPGVVAAAVPSGGPMTITGEQTVLPVDLADGAADDFARAFTLENGPIDASLTQYTVLAYNDGDDEGDPPIPLNPNPPTFIEPYTVGDGTNNWYDIGTGTLPTTTITFDSFGQENGPSNTTYTGAYPWEGNGTQQSSTSNNIWYYVQVQVFTAGSAETSTANCYAKETGAG